MSEKTPKEKEKLSAQEIEREKIFRKADEVKGEQLYLNADNRFESKKEIQEYVLKDIDDPEKKYEVYYKGIQKLLRESLPMGDSNKELREIIHEEKKILITRGHKLDATGRRGADSRMGYIHDLDLVLDIVGDWIMKKGAYFDLYAKLREENEKRGYHKSKTKDKEG